MKTDKAYAKKLSAFANHWVALVGRRVVASGKTLEEVQQEVERKHLKNYVYHFVPPTSLSLVP